MGCRIEPLEILFCCMKRSVQKTTWIDKARKVYSQSLTRVSEVNSSTGISFSNLRMGHIVIALGNCISDGFFDVTVELIESGSCFNQLRICECRVDYMANYLL